MKIFCINISDIYWNIKNELFGYSYEILLRGKNLSEDAGHLFEGLIGFLVLIYIYWDYSYLSINK